MGHQSPSSYSYSNRRANCVESSTCTTTTQIVKTVELEAGDRERGHDWVRIGGRSLREGTRAGGGSSVADLAGEGGKVSSQRGASVGGRKAALRSCTSPSRSLDKKGVFVSTRHNICGIQEVCPQGLKAPDARPSDVADDAEGRRSFTSTGCGTAGDARARVALRPVRVLAMIRGWRFRTMCRCM